MICNSCNKENRTDGKFCRFCGSKLGQASTKLTITLPTFSGLLGVVRRQNKRVILASILVVVTGAGTVFAAPKINDFIKVSSFVKKALQQESAGDYQAALATLVLADNRWTLESKRQDIEELKNDQLKYAQFKVSFESALEKEKNGELVEAREFLQSIGTEYPEYNKVREKSDTIQVVIESDLKEKARLKEVEAQKANAAAAESRRQATVESAAKVRAEAEKAASDAQSRAAAQSARDAELQRQQEAARRAEEVRKSFINQLVTGYNSYNSGASYYSSAISYSNSGSSLSAINQASNARAVLNTARDSVSDLNSRFTGLSSDYRS